MAIRGRYAAISTRPTGDSMVPPTHPGTIRVDEDAFARLRSSGPGMVRLYELRTGGWTEIASLEHPEKSLGDEFGTALAFGDGVLLIGANRSHADDGSDTGDAVVVSLSAL